jgi:hypothetical protein
MASKSRDFDKILLVAIDDALLSLGESARMSIYFHIEKNYRVNRDDIPQQLEPFQTALEKIFGVGARFIEILIMRNLYGKVGRYLSLEKNEGLEFLEYVEAARQGYIKKDHSSDNC